MKDKKVPRRHRVAYQFGHLASIFPLMRYTCHCERAPELEEPCLIVSNHLTESDFLVLMRSFPKHMYFVCGEHLCRSKFGPILSKLYAPIPAPRGGSKLGTVLQVLRKLKEGNNVVIFPEGCRSFNGVTLQADLAIGQLVKKAGCGLVTYKIIGGYFVAPRWSYKPRKGHMEGRVEHVYSSDALKEMTPIEITGIINRDLYEDAYDRQKKSPLPYRSRHLAEGIENYLEICPECGSYDSMTSSGNSFRCTCCGLEGIYDKYGFLHGANGKTLPFDNVRNWGIWMEHRFDEDIRNAGTDDLPVFTESGICLYRVDVCKHIRTDVFGDAEMKIYLDRIELTDNGEKKIFDFDGISEFSMLYFGKTWLFTHRGEYMGITGERFHAWKLDRLFAEHFRKRRKTQADSYSSVSADAQ